MESQHANRSDAELLTHAVKGDRQAFAVLYERYLEALYRYCYYRVADEREAEDLTETVFLKIWEALADADGCSPIRNFRAWVYRVAHNLIIDRHRTRRETQPILDEQSLVDPQPLPERMVESNEAARRIARAIATLDATLQQVVVCRFINRFSHNETAEILGLSEGHVRVLQHRALKKLQAVLDKDV